MSNPTAPNREDLVPDDVIPHHALPPMRYEELPKPLSWKKMIGPGLMLAGVALGGGEYILWPYIVYKIGFVFIWACFLGVLTQFFLNMEIERWTLATGESAITGFCRMSKQWAWVFLLCNIIPWAWPAWATGAAQIVNWMAVNQLGVAALRGEEYVNYFGIAGLVIVGIVLTAGPVVYNTVEKIQVFLVTFILVLLVTLAIMVVKPYAVTAMLDGAIHVGSMPDLDGSELSMLVLFGALAFAGAGGTTNLGQSNFINDKGYGMGRFIGRITSPITGQEEAVPEVGYHFRHTDANLSRWKQWWRAANIEHFLSFFVTCILCLVLMTLVTYSLFYDADGNLLPGMETYQKGMGFIWGQAEQLGKIPTTGKYLQTAYLLMGIAVLLTTELGVLDVVSRISADIVKVNYLRESKTWSISKLYYCFLWGEILLGSIILLFPTFDKPVLLITISAALNGGVMFLFSILLLYMNNKVLSRKLSMSPLRFLAVVWACGFFGYFTLLALKGNVIPWVMSLFQAG